MRLSQTFQYLIRTSNKICYSINCTSPIISTYYHTTRPLDKPSNALTNGGLIVMGKIRSTNHRSTHAQSKCHLGLIWLNWHMVKNKSEDHHPPSGIQRSSWPAIRSITQFTRTLSRNKHLYSTLISFTSIEGSLIHACISLISALESRYPPKPI